MEEKILGFRLIKIDVLFFFFTRHRPLKSDPLVLRLDFSGSRLFLFVFT